MLLVAGFLVGELTGLQLSKLHFSTNLIISYSYLIFLCTVVGYVEFFWLLRIESASIANSFVYSTCNSSFSWMVSFQRIDYFSNNYCYLYCTNRCGIDGQ
jgi:hypothetical protein